ncbi:hypothetical protein BROSI_B0023 [Candidatus Brocadia sinica JPN1]|uniref:Uncharacterized protein n=1 Tax=Candidatus Brocadia sinica JPN1 TaxID=1197129 RepID=A0ABQ0K451_9BACT|nr:hypothetical protein BROSI_B0023 [Candidatus Brocadia sinica JPN1]
MKCKAKNIQNGAFILQPYDFKSQLINHENLSSFGLTLIELNI